MIGRLAVDHREQGNGIGSKLLKHALKGIAVVVETGGGKFVLVHAKDEKAAEFYARFDFEPSPTGELTLILSIADLRHNLGLPPLGQIT